MSIVFLNSHRAKSGYLEGGKLPDGYILLSKFFDCGVIDRTSTLDQGFDYKVLENIPVVSKGFNLLFADISDLVADSILGEAVRSGRQIDVLWSGGIDSTVALISLIKRNKLRKEKGRIRVLLTINSIDEYPLFFSQHILDKLEYTPVTAPIISYVADEALVVTGEHGDQLFGSDKVLPMIENGLAFLPYDVTMPIHLMDKFRNVKKVDKVMTYLQPLIAYCPKKIESTIDLFWWLNFTIKWQQVSLRLAAFYPSKTESLYKRFRHFFNAPEFQMWAMSGHEPKILEDLQSYKYPAKKLILDYTQDEDYFRYKSKRPSLQHVILDRKKQGDERYRVHMKDDFVPIIETFHKKLKNKISKNISE